MARESDRRGEKKLRPECRQPGERIQSGWRLAILLKMEVLMNAEQTRLSELWAECSFCLREVARNPGLQDLDQWTWIDRAAFLQVPGVRRAVERFVEECGGAGLALQAAWSIEQLSEIAEWGKLAPWNVAQLRGGLCEAIDRAGKSIELITQSDDRTEILFVRGASFGTGSFAPHLKMRSNRSKFFRDHKIATKRLPGGRDIYANYGQLRAAYHRAYRVLLPPDPPAELSPIAAAEFDCGSYVESCCHQLQAVFETRKAAVRFHESTKAQGEVA